MKFKLSIFLSLALLASACYSAQQWCTGVIRHTYINKQGNLYIFGDWRNEHTQICNLNSLWQGVEPEVCKGWLSIALAAKLSGAKVTVQYNDVASCSEVPRYETAPSPSYIMVTE